jgi:hypothetical protein
MTVVNAVGFGDPSGEIRVLAQTSRQKAACLPTCFRLTPYPAATRCSGWPVAPAGTPPEIVAQLNSAVSAAILDASGLRKAGSIRCNGARFAQYVRKTPTAATVIKANNMAEAEKSRVNMKRRKHLIAEMRNVYDQDGMIDSYLELYNRQIVPNHRKYGINVLGAWYDRQKNQVIWIRTFASREERKAKLDIYEVSPERDAEFPIARYHILGVKVRILE